MSNRPLAKTLRAIAADPLALMRGRLAEEVVREIRRAGGNISMEDVRVGGGGAGEGGEGGGEGGGVGVGQEQGAVVGWMDRGGRRGSEEEGGSGGRERVRVWEWKCERCWSICGEGGGRG